MRVTLTGDSIRESYEIWTMRQGITFKGTENWGGMGWLEEMIAVRSLATSLGTWISLFPGPLLWLRDVLRERLNLIFKGLFYRLDVLA